MVIVMKPGVSQEKIQALVTQLERDQGVKVGITNGVGCSILGLVGDTAHIDMDKLTMNDDVERVMRVQEPYKKANRKFHPEDTVADVSGVPIGGAGRFTVIAGPCSVESEGQIVEVARDVKQAGAALLRGGAFKPRTSPYSFQGMGTDALELLLEAKAATGLPIVSEIMAPRYCGLFEEKVDLVQIGARNMQNFDLLKEVGRLSKPVLLKRGLSNTYEEWIMSAEYIMAAGNENVILCERGVRTFETFTRNTLDLSAIPENLAVKEGITKRTFPLAALYITFCNSLLEEYFFRGFAFLALYRTGRKKLAYSFSALAFALYHVSITSNWGSPVLILLMVAGLTAAGLLFNWLDREGSLLPSWLVHMGANLGTNAVGLILFGIL